MEKLPDRHLECSSCKKPIAYIYTEVIDKIVCRVSMCSDCPLLKKKMFDYVHPNDTESLSAAHQLICCGSCGLTEDEVRMGSPLGCSLCYEVFEDILIKELAQAHHITLKPSLKKPVLYLGRHPKQSDDAHAASKLIALHQALNDTIGREDYEQAARLRDQIKALTKEKKNND